MKKLLKSANLPALTMAAGGIGLLLRVWLLKSGVDSRGFLVLSHPAHILLWIVVAIVMAGLILLTKDLVEAHSYTFNFPASRISSLGLYLAAFGIGFGAFLDVFSVTTGMELLLTVMGLVTSLMLVLSGHARRRGAAPAMLSHIVISIYLVMRLIAFWRAWNFDPQILDYCFPLLATAFLMLATYHRAAFDINSGKRRPYAFCSLSAVFFSYLSLIGSDNILFFMSVAVWLTTDLCSLIPMPGFKLFQFPREDREC
jgi:hypothetical protein